MGLCAHRALSGPIDPRRIASCTGPISASSFKSSILLPGQRQSTIVASEYKGSVRPHGQYVIRGSLHGLSIEVKGPAYRNKCLPGCVGGEEAGARGRGCADARLTRPLTRWPPGRGGRRPPPCASLGSVCARSLPKMVTAEGGHRRPKALEAAEGRKAYIIAYVAAGNTLYYSVFPSWKD